jgi:hypothetical protein
MTGKPDWVASSDRVSYPFSKHSRDRVQQASVEAPALKSSDDRTRNLCFLAPQLLVSSTVIAQHRERDRPASEGLIGQTDPAITLGRDSELVVQVLKMLFDGCLRNEQLTGHPAN